MSPCTQVGGPSELPSQQRRTSTATVDFARQKRVEVACTGELPDPSGNHVASNSRTARQERPRFAFPGELPQPERSSRATNSKNAPQKRRDTAVSVFKTHSWSVWTEKEVLPQDSEVVEPQQPARARLGFLKRLRKDRVLHFLLALITTVGLTLIVAGVIYEETHGMDPKEGDH